MKRKALGKISGIHNRQGPLGQIPTAALGWRIEEKYCVWFPIPSRSPQNWLPLRGEGIYRCVLVTFGKKTPGGAGTHTGHTRETGAHGHTDLTDEPVDEPHNVNSRNTCKIPKAEEILLPSSRFSWLRWTARGPPSSPVSRSTRTWLLLSRRISTSLASAA